MTDDRPRPQYGEHRPPPQYGEYASPQEQAKAMGASLPPITHYAPVVNRPTNAQPYGAPTSARRNASGKIAPRRWDLILSSGLLAYGLINVISGFFQFSDMGRLIDDVYSTQGVGDFTSTSLSGAFGVVINVTNVVLWLVGMLLTVRLLRRGKIAFYVPLLAGAVASIVAATCMMVLLFSDPAFSDYVNGQ